MRSDRDDRPTTGSFTAKSRETLYLYDFADTSPTRVTYFDDVYNYTEFRGSGFTFNAENEPLSGVVNFIHDVSFGYTIVLLAGINVPATTILHIGRHQCRLQDLAQRH